MSKIGGDVVDESMRETQTQIDQLNQQTTDINKFNSTGSMDGGYRRRRRRSKARRSGRRTGGRRTSGRRRSKARRGGRRSRNMRKSRRRR